MSTTTRTREHTFAKLIQTSIGIQPHDRTYILRTLQETPGSWDDQVRVTTKGDSNINSGTLTSFFGCIFLVCVTVVEDITLLGSAENNSKNHDNK